MSLEITPSLKGSLGELYYKEGCDQKGWAYVSLENIYLNKTITPFKDKNVLVFKKGFHRISVRIPQQHIVEIMNLSEPTNKSAENPSFVFDYLACRVGQKYTYEGIIEANQPKAALLGGNKDKGRRFFR